MMLPGRRPLALLAVATFALLASPPTARAQRSRVIRRLEAEAWVRVARHARQSGGLTLDAGQFDLRLPIHGPFEEVIGATSHARDALAVASVRLEPTDSSVGSRDERFTAGRYDLRLEDRAGNCVAVHQEVRLADDRAIERGARIVERCRPLYMADVVRRARRLAHLPLSAGQLTDHWSVAGALTGWADVYADSVVILASTIALSANHPTPDTGAVYVDSLVVGLARGDGSWDIQRRSAGLAVDTALHRGGTWSRRARRLTIPIDSTFPLSESWPVVEVRLRVPRTADNPYGWASTYAHAPKPFFPARIGTPP